MAQGNAVGEDLHDVGGRLQRNELIGVGEISGGTRGKQISFAMRRLHPVTKREEAKGP